MPEIPASLLTGAVVGWMVFYFIRHYRKFTPAVPLGRRLSQQGLNQRQEAFRSPTRPKAGRTDNGSLSM